SMLDHVSRHGVDIPGLRREEDEQDEDAQPSAVTFNLADPRAAALAPSSPAKGGRRARRLAWASAIAAAAALLVGAVVVQTRSARHPAPNRITSTTDSPSSHPAQQTVATRVVPAIASEDAAAPAQTVSSIASPAAQTR